VLVNRVVGVRKLITHGMSVLGSFQTHEEHGLRVLRAVFLKLPGQEKRNIRRWSRSTRRLYGRYVKRHGKPDLILAHSVTWAGYAASLIGKRYGIPYLIVEHRSFFVWSTPEAQKMVKPFYLPFFEEAYRQCFRLVPVSESLLTGLRSLMPWIDEKVEVVPNMIREDMFLPPELPRKCEPFVFFWAGRLEHVKGIDQLLEAAAELHKQQVPPFLIRLAGRGSLRPQLEQQARELGIYHLVTFLGRISRQQIQEEMQQACCFVLPTRYEAFGAVLIEAMATGMPVIATRSGGPQFIVTGEGGFLVDPGDVPQLTAAMGRMMQEYGTFNQEKIRAAILDRFGEKRILEKYGQLFQEMKNKNSQSK
jgi:glycosyltransferase involved in cell wall biosynthesis